MDAKPRDTYKIVQRTKSISKASHLFSQGLDLCIPFASKYNQLQWSDDSILNTKLM